MGPFPSGTAGLGGSQKDDSPDPFASRACGFHIETGQERRPADQSLASCSILHPLAVAAEKYELPHVDDGAMTALT